MSGDEGAETSTAGEKQPSPDDGDRRPPSGEHRNQLLEFRRHLAEARASSQGDYDKAILSLSGGALGVTFVFLIERVADQNQVESPGLAFLSWVAWGLSVIATLISFYVSEHAHGLAIQRMDAILRGEGAPRPSRFPNTLISGLNLAAGALFILGVLVISVFASRNLERGANDGRRLEVEAPCCGAASGRLEGRPSSAEPGNGETRTNDDRPAAASSDGEKEVTRSPERPGDIGDRPDTQPKEPGSGVVPTLPPPEPPPAPSPLPPPPKERGGGE